MKYKMEQLINRSYEAIKSRGLIDETTTIEDFLNKITEELKEADHENFLINNWGQMKSLEPYIMEVMDIATVCLMQVMHLGYDPIKEFEKVVLKNEKRANEMPDKI